MGERGSQAKREIEDGGRDGERERVHRDVDRDIDGGTERKK